MFGFIRKSIARKVGIMVGACCLVVTLGGLAWLIAQFRSDILVHSRSSLELLARSLEAAFSSFDEQARTHPVADVINELGGQEEIVRVRVFDPNGRIVWSRGAGEPGTQLPEALLKPWRQGQTSLAPSGRSPTLSALRQVRARSSCLRCHGAKGANAGDILGGLQIEASYAKLTDKLTGYSQLQVILALLLVAFVTVMSVFMVRLFLGQPLQKISQAIESAREGNFLQRVDLASHDEFGKLAEDFNRLLARLTDMQASQIDADMELERAQREVKLGAELEDKNRIIEETNRSLTMRLNELTLLFDINRALTSTLELDQVLRIITEMIGNTLGFREFAVLLLDQRNDRLEVRSTFGQQAPGTGTGAFIDLRIRFFAGAIRKGHTVLLSDLRNVNREGADDRLLPATGSFLSIPMRYKDRVLGLLNFTRPDPDAFLPEEIKLLTSVAQQAAMAILNAQLYQEKLELSVTDELTKLPNRRQMQDRLLMEWNRAQRYSTALSLLMIDIDHFKRYNDVNGHLLGDRVLEGVARVLENNTRKVDTVARFGGEEFLVILPGQDKPTAATVAEKLCRTVARTQLPRVETQPGGHLSISVGVASHPGDADDPQQLLHLADLALYVAKNGGRGRVVAYQESMETIEEERRLAMAREAEMSFRRRRRPGRPVPPAAPTTAKPPQTPPPASPPKNNHG